MSKDKLIWYLKQLFPLTWYTTCTPSENNKEHKRRFFIWKMWLGKTYDVVEFVID